MAEKTILVCDRCGGDGAQRVQVVLGTRRVVTDLCPTHLTELTGAARPLRRTRRPASAGGKTTKRRPSAKDSTKRASARGRKSRAARARRPLGASNQNPDVASAVQKLRSQGMSYRQVGDALIKRGIKPKRAARWNPIVLSRMVKGSAA
jgi:hypothetical protein